MGSAKKNDQAPMIINIALELSTEENNQENTFQDEGHKLWDSSLQYLHVLWVPGSDSVKLQNHVAFQNHVDL